VEKASKMAWRRNKDVIEMDLKNVGYLVIKWIYLALGRNK
jgi:hypothetical protein